MITTNPTENNAIYFHCRIAAQFARKYESSVSFKKRFLVWTALLDQYVNRTDSVMDLGCGPGVFSRYLAGKGCTVTGIDGSATMIAYCNQQKTPGDVRYHTEALPLASPIDHDLQHVIMASSLLEYMDDLVPMLNQINRMLLPRGIFIVSMPNRLSVYRRIEKLVFRLSSWPPYVFYLRHVSTEDRFTQQLAALGFDRLDVVYFSGDDPISRLLTPILPERYVNNLFVGVYQKRPPAHENS